MAIKNEEISVVVQGAVIKNETIQSIASVRKFLPGAKIILSTWQKSDVNDCDVDDIVLSWDPGSYPCAVLPQGKKILYNLNRQLVSTQNGLKNVKTKYVLKIRSDMYLTKDFQENILEYFYKFKLRDKKYSFFKHRVIVGSLTSKFYSDSLDNSFPLPFHISDWFCFGLTDDVKDYFLNTPLLNEQYASNYPCNTSRVPVKMYSWQISPEQYFCSMWAKRYINLKFDDWSNWNTKNVLLSEKIIANNFIVLDTVQTGLYLNKYIDLIKDNDGEVFSFQGYISYLKFLELYSKYCDSSYSIPFYLYYTRNLRHNKLVKQLRLSSTNRKWNFKKYFIKLKLFLLEQKIIYKQKNMKKYKELYGYQK